MKMDQRYRYIQLEDNVRVSKSLFKSGIKICFFLTILIFIAGWLIGYGIIKIPTERVAVHLPKPVPVKKEPLPTKPLEPLVSKEDRILPVPVEKPVTPKPVEKGILSEDILNLKVKDPIGESPTTVMVFTKTGWQQKEPDGSIKPVSLESKRLFYSVAVDICEKDSADKQIGTLSQEGYTPYMIPAVDTNGQERFIIVIGDHEKLKKASLEASDFYNNKKRQAWVVCIDPLSVMPLKNAYQWKEQSLFPYTLRLASYQKIERSMKGFSHFKNKGISPYIAKIDLKDGKVWWSIYFGHYPTQQDAEKAKKENGLSDAIVKEMPYANLLGIFSSETQMESAIQYFESVAGYSPYVIKCENGMFMLLSDAYVTKEGMEHDIVNFKDKGIHVWVVKR